jgi:hypothetical protein
LPPQFLIPGVLRERQNKSRKALGGFAW